MLKKTETEETIVFFCDIFIIGSISIGEWGPGPLAPLATPMMMSPQNGDTWGGLLPRFP